MNVELFDQTVELDASHIAASEAEIREEVAEYATGERKEFDLGVTLVDGFAGEVILSAVIL